MLPRLFALALLAVLAGSPSPPSVAAQQSLQRLDGSWRIESASKQGAFDGAVADYVSFEAANALLWYRFIADGACTRTRHRYWELADRLEVRPLLPEQRQWWNLVFETPNRIRLLERRPDSAEHQIVQLLRAPLPAERAHCRE